MATSTNICVIFYKGYKKRNTNVFFNVSDTLILSFIRKLKEFLKYLRYTYVIRYNKNVT